MTTIYKEKHLQVATTMIGNLLQFLHQFFAGRQLSSEKD